MYQAVYKCRLCGKLFRYKRLYKEKSAVKKIWNLGMIIPYTANSTQFTEHYCQDGSIGLADFIGFKKAED